MEGTFQAFSRHGGTRTVRPELAKVLGQTRSGDQICIWRLDRLARSLRHLIDIADDLNRRSVALKSITESIAPARPQVGSCSTSSVLWVRWSARSLSGALARWHDLRHTFASWFAQSGGDLYHLSCILGHSTVQMTTQYSHLRTGDLHAELRRLAQSRPQDHPIEAAT